MTMLAQEKGARDRRSAGPGCQHDYSGVHRHLCSNGMYSAISAQRQADMTARLPIRSESSMTRPLEFLSRKSSSCDGRRSRSRMRFAKNIRGTIDACFARNDIRLLYVQGRGQLKKELSGIPASAPANPSRAYRAEG